MQSRFGKFFLLVAAVCGILFFASAQSKQPYEPMLGFAVIFGLLGIFLVARNLKPAPPVERFRGIHKAQKSWNDRKSKAKKK
jgi:hypothetical protein